MAYTQAVLLYICHWPLVFFLGSLCLVSVQKVYVRVGKARMIFFYFVRDGLEDSSTVLRCQILIVKFVIQDSAVRRVSAQFTGTITIIN